MFRIYTTRERERVGKSLGFWWSWSWELWMQKLCTRISGRMEMNLLVFVFLFLDIYLYKEKVWYCNVQCFSLKHKNNMNWAPSSIDYSMYLPKFYISKLHGQKAQYYYVLFLFEAAYKFCLPIYCTVFLFL